MAKVTSFSKSTLNVRGKIFSFDRPVVMGILNVTKDSFHDGGKYIDDEAIRIHASRIISEGAAIIDVGACSTRPGAIPVAEDEEIENICRAIKIVRKINDEVLISADTYRSTTAAMAMKSGADIINDVSGGEMDKNMFALIAELRVPYILMHMKGTPETMQADPQYINVTLEVLEFFKTKTDQLKKMGVNDIILDPGFGFGKNLDHNYELLRNLNLFKQLGYPVLAGVSRKGMINKVLGTKPAEALNGTTVLNTIAVLNGASILRVHDAKEASEVIRLVGRYSGTKN